MDDADLVTAAKNTCASGVEMIQTKDGIGGDPKKLGRWTWTRIGGKDGIVTIFVSTSGVEMIQKMQALMTEWCGCIWATGEYIAPAKTRWFLTSFFWTRTDWEYETKDSLPRNIILTGQDDNMYTFSREELTTASESLEVPTDLANQSPNSLDAVTKICQVYSTQMNNAKCNTTSCLNAFNTSFMPTLSHRMIAT